MAGAWVLLTWIVPPTRLLLTGAGSAAKPFIRCVCVCVCDSHVMSSNGRSRASLSARRAHFGCRRRRAAAAVAARCSPSSSSAPLSAADPLTDPFEWRRQERSRREAKRMTDGAGIRAPLSPAPVLSVRQYYLHINNKSASFAAAAESSGAAGKQRPPPAKGSPAQPVGGLRRLEPTLERPTEGEAADSISAKSKCFGETSTERRTRRTLVAITKSSHTCSSPLNGSRRLQAA